MHRILELLDVRDPKYVDTTVRSICALTGLADHADEIAELVLACRDAPVVSRFRASARWWTEVPYTLRFAEGYATGRIDLVFEEDGELVVVDWKSDAVGPSGVEGATEAHRPQAEAYVRALEATTGMHVKEVVFVFARARSR